MHFALVEILNKEKKYFYCYIFTIEKMQILTFRLPAMVLALLRLGREVCYQTSQILLAATGVNTAQTNLKNQTENK
jgi:hypothetical protein